MACPYFIPEERCESELWPHRSRLPLGDGYTGRCSAPGHEDAELTDEMLRDACNLGNARCPRLPADRAADSIRFHVAADAGSTLTLQYCTEREHRPAGSGLLTWEAASASFVPAAAASIESLAAAFVRSHLQKNPRSLSART